MQGKRTGTNPVTFRESNDMLPLTRLRYQRMARELRLTDQILSFDVDSVGITDTGIGAPAWTTADGSSITIDAGMMPPLKTRRQIAVWLGTNAHELFHNLFTPRQDSLLMRRVTAAQKSSDPGIHRSWNVLEDQRIERLGLARFEAWRGYLIAALSHHIPSHSNGAWCLLAGRTWLPDAARATARATFVATNDEASARQVAELIGDYQRLFDPGDDDADEAWRIVYEFHHAFGQNVPPKGGCGGSTIKSGEPELDDPDDNFYPMADEADEDDGDDESGGEAGDDDGGDEGEPGDESDDESDGEPGDEAGDDDGDESDDDGDADGGDGSDESDSDGSGDDGDGDEGDEGDGDPGDGCSAPGDDDTSTPPSLDEALDEAIDEALGDDETAADLDRVQDNLDHGASGGGDLPPSAGQWLEATNEARLLARDVATVLSDIRDECEAAWVRRTDTGRFSVARWATDPDWDADNVFDFFDPGAMDAAGLDVTLVLDVSGSMSSQIMRLAEATWAIRHAIDRVEGTCNSLAFGSMASQMFPSGRRPDGRMFVPNLEGSTNPTPALREAHRLVCESAATNRLVITLTDGSWWNTAAATEAMRAINSAGATTCVVGLGREAARFVTPGFAEAHIARRIADSGELVDVFREMATRAMLEAAGRG